MLIFLLYAQTGELFQVPPTSPNSNPRWKNLYFDHFALPETEAQAPLMAVVASTHSTVSEDSNTKAAALEFRTLPAVARASAQIDSGALYSDPGGVFVVGVCASWLCLGCGSRSRAAPLGPTPPPRVVCVVCMSGRFVIYMCVAYHGTTALLTTHRSPITLQ